MGNFLIYGLLISFPLASYTLCDPIDYNLPDYSVHGILQAYWSGLTFPSPGGLPDPGIEPGSPAFQADSLSSDPPGKPLILLFRLEWWDKNNIINRYNKLSSTTISFFFYFK